MNIKEIFRSISDEISNRVSDPESVAAFPGHLEHCTKTQFIQERLITRGPPPSWSNLGWGFKIEALELTCSECGGTIVEKFD